MQSSQTAQYPEARAGMVCGDIRKATIDGKCVAEVAIAPGLFVTQGTADNQVKLPTSAAEVQATGRGFAMLQMSKGANGSANHYAIGDAVQVLEDGVQFWGVAGEDLAKGDPVFVIHGATGRGQIRNDVSAGATEAAQLAGCRVEKDALSGEPVLITVNTSTRAP